MSLTKKGLPAVLTDLVFSMLASSSRGSAIIPETALYSVINTSIK